LVYVTVGTLFLDFPRLVLAADAIARDTGERVVVQTGLGTTLPVCAEHFDFKPRDEVLDIQREARVVVAHAEIGCVIDALEAGRPLVVVPRFRRFNEHLTDHQLDLARAVARRGWGLCIEDIAELAGAVANPPAPLADYRPARHRLVSAVRDAVERVAARKA
jgi:beta-1,4-N-acetylglucosaminyltransferase